MNRSSGDILIRNNRGFSLIETMVALGIIGIISLGLAQMMKESINSSNYSESKFDELEMSRQLQLQLSLKEGCDLNFKNKPIQSLDPVKYDFLLKPIVGVLGGLLNNSAALVGIDNFNSLVDSHNRPLLAVGDLVGNRSLKITSMGYNIPSADWASYQSIKSTITATSPGAVTMGFLVVTGERVKTSLGGKTFTRALPVRVLLDANEKINGCYTDAEAAADAAITVINNQITNIVNNTTNNNNTTINQPKSGCNPGNTPMGWFGCMAAAFFGATF